MRIIITCMDCGHTSRVEKHPIPADFSPACAKCGSESVVGVVVETWQEYQQHEQEIAEIREQADRMVREAQASGL